MEFELPQSIFSAFLRKLYKEVRYLKRIVLFILVLIFAALGISGCSVNNNAEPSATSYEPGTLLGTAGQGTYRVSDEPVSPDATLNPLLSPASTF